MGNNLLDQFTAYVETLCKQHVDIRHTEYERRFVELNSDEQLSKSKDQLFPFVALDKLTINYSGQEDATRKSRYVELLFLDRAEAGDFAGIQAVKNKMERVAEDFIRKMKADRKKRNEFPFLRTLQLSGIEFNFIENKMIGVYGGLLSFNFELPFVEDLPAGRFVN